MEIKIIKSKKRRRSASARENQGTLILRVPWFLPEGEINKLTNHFLKRFASKHIQSDSDLQERSLRLNQKVFQNKIGHYSITWSSRQNKAFGVCSFRKRQIRISTRLKKVPLWVLDATIVHEMAHLIEPNHSHRFYALTKKYRLSEKARGYLQGYQDALNASGQSPTPNRDQTYR